MARAGWAIGRDQTYRLMRLDGIAGVHRGRKPVTTRAATTPDDRPDLVQREFTAAAFEPCVGSRFHLCQNLLWVLL